MKALAVAFLVASATLFASALDTAGRGHSRHNPPSLKSSLPIPSSSSSSASEEIVFSQIIHRHGARTPLPPANASLICPDIGCGQLTDNGRDMLVALGKLLKRRYGSGTSASASSVYFEGDAYDPNVIYTRSTSYDRTIQSAAGVLKGIYPDAEAFYPEIYSAAENKDTLLLYGALPGFSIHFAYTAAARYDALTPTREKLFPAHEGGEATIQRMADELSLGGYCRSVGFTVCAYSLYDTSACLEAEGRLPSYPTVMANKPKLDALFQEFFHITFGYNASSVFSQQIGSPGQPAVQQMISNMKSFIKGDTKKMPYRFMHYSAHDTTLAPWAVTIGGGYDEMLPVFGKVYILDLIKDVSNTSAQGTYFVRGTKGSPQLTPGPHTYSLAPLRIGGIDEKGTLYYTDASKGVDRVPIDDFVRFIDSTKPRSSKGICFISPEVASYYGIDKVNVAPTTAQCRNYRTNCPQWACPKASVLDTNTLICKQS